MKMRCYLSNSLNNEWWLLQIIVFATANSHTHGMNRCKASWLLFHSHSPAVRVWVCIGTTKPLDDTSKYLCARHKPTDDFSRFSAGFFMLIPLKTRIYLFIDWFRWKYCLARMQTKTLAKRRKEEKRINTKQNKTNRTKTYAHPHSLTRADRHRRDQITFISMSWIRFQQFSLPLVLMETLSLHSSTRLDSFLFVVVACFMAHWMYCSIDCVRLIESFLFLEKLCQMPCNHISYK